MMPSDKERQPEAAVFRILERAATERRRCPTNLEIAAELNASLTGTRRSATSIPSIIQNLVRQGLVTVRIYGTNYRDVIILEGPNAGKITLGPNHGSAPYMTIDKAERERRDKRAKWRR